MHAQAYAMSEGMRMCPGMCVIQGGLRNLGQEEGLCLPPACMRAHTHPHQPQHTQTPHPHTHPHTHTHTCTHPLTHTHTHTHMQTGTLICNIGPTLLLKLERGALHC